MTSRCKKCGAEIKGRTRRGLVCEDCKRQYREEYQAEYYKANFERVSERKKRKHIPKPPTLTKCIVCGKNFGSTRGRLICSVECKKKKEYERLKKRIEEIRADPKKKAVFMEEQRQRSRLHYLRHPEKHKLSTAKWVKNNLERHKESVRIYGIKWRAINQERVNEQKLLQYWGDPEKAREKGREYYHKNLEKSRQRSREYYHRRKGLAS